jgi:hypothetical protein
VSGLWSFLRLYRRGMVNRSVPRWTPSQNPGLFSRRSGEDDNSSHIQHPEGSAVTLDSISNSYLAHLCVVIVAEVFYDKDKDD